MSNEYTVIDLFAGAGGFGLGFRLAGFNIKVALEVDEWAVDTLNANNINNETIILQDDIRSFDNLYELKQFSPVPPDIVIGGPPCQGFSIAGPSKDPNDPRNTLFMDFARWVGHFQPKVFVMENVTGLLHRKNAKGDKVIDIIIEKFESLGYSVEVWNLNAAEYGVPQHRNRIFIVGNIFGRKIEKPNPTHFIRAEVGKDSGAPLKSAITVWEAISDLPVIRAGEGQEIMRYSSAPNNEFQNWVRSNSHFVLNHEAMKHSKRMIERYEAIQNGTSFDSLPEGLKVKRRNGNGELSEIVYQSNYRHLKKSMVAYTIPASFYSNFIHPIIPRNITSREAARLQSFPDNYQFKGKRTQISSKLLAKIGKNGEDHLSQYNQIGNAVPPLLAKAVADKIKFFLNSMRVM